MSRGRERVRAEARVDELRKAAYVNNGNIAYIFDNQQWNGYLMTEELLSFCEERDNTVLIEGISNSSIKFINALLDQPFTQHVNTNCRSYTHCTPLILCISKGWTHCDSDSQHALSEVAIRLVTEKKANVHGRDKYKRTALHYACLHRNLDAITFLIRNGALWNTPDEDGLTPLDFIFYDYERAYQILYHVSGGEFFTLNKNNFKSDYDVNLLITALGIEVENKSSEESFVLKSQKNKERQKLLEPIRNYFSEIIEINERSFLCFYKETLSNESHEDQNKRSFYRVYEQLMGLAFQVTFSSDEFEKSWCNVSSVNSIGKQNRFY